MLPALRELSALLGIRAATAPRPEAVAAAERLRGHVDEFVIPRATDLDAPLLVVILGSTGSGKSSLFNALAGAPLSQVGVLRPTTRVAMAMAPPGGTLPDPVQRFQDEGVLEVVRHQSGWSEVVLVDAPDFDSIEADNRVLARRLLEAADLLIFVTTDTRYADEVPWSIMARARQRGVPMLSVINRLPDDVLDREAVLDDYRRLLRESGIGGLEPGESTLVVGVALGAVDSEIDALDADEITPVRSVLERLVDDDEKRRALIRQSLEAALADLPRMIDGIVAELETEAGTRRELLGMATEAYTHHRTEIGSQIDKGTFLRTEILREWQEFVGANRVARALSEGIGKLAAVIRSVFSPGPPAPAGEVREAALSDLTAMVVSHIDAAAAETAAAWARRPFAADAVAGSAELWGASPDAGERFEEKLQSWATELSAEIMTMGERRREVARAASLGVNVVGTGAILAVFASTGGLTGAEAGIAAATAVVNQALLEAIFGEANVARFVTAARERLDGIMDEIVDDDRSRFEHALGLSPESEELAQRLRTTMDRLQT